MSEKDDLDLVLDTALRSYADPDAHSGSDSDLAQRIFAQHRRRQCAPRTTSRGEIDCSGQPDSHSSLQAFCSSSSPRRGVGLRRTLSTQKQLSKSRARRQELEAKHVLVAVQPIPHTSQERNAPLHRTTGVGAKARCLPPLREPLSAQERALDNACVASALSRAEKDAITAQQTAAPLHIAAISIPSIEPPEEGKE